MEKILFHYAADNMSRRLVKKVEKELKAAVRSTTVITHQIYGLDEPEHDIVLPCSDHISLYFVTTQGMKSQAFRTALENVLENVQENEWKNEWEGLSIDYSIYKRIYILSPKTVDGLTQDDRVWDVIYDNTTWFKHINTDSFRWRYSFYAILYELLYGTPSKDAETPQPCDMYWRGLYKLSNFTDLNDILVARELLEEASAQNNMYALNYVGTSYLMGVIPFDVNEETGINLIRKAAKMGNPLALNLYGKCRFYGTAIEQDYRKAFILLKMAAETEDAQVFELLGQAYRDGLGCQQDWKMAWNLFNKARSRKILDNLKNRRIQQRTPEQIRKELWKRIAYNTETCF